MKRVETVCNIEALPLIIQEYAKAARIYDSSCSENARTFFLDGTVRSYLKLGKKGALEKESRMMDFVSREGLAPKVIAYISDVSEDYLLMEAVTGEDGVSGGHLDNPSKLAHVFGEYLRLLHSLPTTGCPYPSRTAEMLAEAQNKHADMEILKHLKGSPVDDVIIHGDYCLPNIIMEHYQFKGFIDLGSGGIGDRHYDLYWGLWTLAYNLKTDQYKDTFLDAYGKADINEDRLEFCSVLANLVE
ncbi:aminoglycoside 3'-phosphotransferase [Paenibacillus agricola]|uniref:Aminoglycoside 3'-phosphotransferase n=1 Tax=Paenibacillus agricola TaxID=2716264 RepID=A0ABX0JGK5_9BACL|nr:aminoglycoside 3'-phosphotransferase [Paenibacillus agricola]NHN33384.1 aminoglycoside 3'-phosphotransferase [Paenibacillus agricola]